MDRWVMKFSGAARRGAVLVPLVRRRVDHIAGADLDNVPAAGLHEPSSLGDVQGLPDGMRWAVRR